MIADIEIINKKPWLSEKFKPSGNSIWHVPTMVTKEEKLMLSWLAENYVKGQGQIVDLGSFLGGSTVFLADGLNKNKVANKIATKIFCYDVFFIPPRDIHVIDYFFTKNNIKFPADGNILPLFEKYTSPFKHLIKVNSDRIEKIKVETGDIELLFVDIMKSPISYNYIVQEFFSKLIPEQSIVILQDYLYKNSGPWHAILMEKLSDYFVYITDTGVNSVVYLNTKPLSKEVLETCIWENISFEEKVSLLEKAKSKWTLIPQVEILENQIKRLKSDAFTN